MATTEKTQIKVETTVNAPIEKVWKMFVTPEDIIHWNNASEDWCSPKAENDLRQGGKFVYRMEAKDGSVGFDFWGIYDEVKTNERIAYTMGDDRKVEVLFTGDGSETKVVETFEAEGTHSIELQQGGWRAILNNFKKYVEAN
jgi:uncharacterized protein YndB with AHSA1/START domain